MNKVLKLFFILALLILLQPQSYACWDDDDDDYYGYWDDDDWDDYDYDWYDYDWYWGDYDSDSDGDDDDSVWLDELVCEGDAPDYGSLLDDDDPDEDIDCWLDWLDDLDWYDDSHENSHISVSGGPGGSSKKNKKYVIKDTDKTSVSKEKLRQIEGTKQSTTNSCVSAGIVISSMLFDVSLSESVVINEIFKKELAADPKNALSILNGEYNKERLPGEIISIFESQKISAHDIGGVNGIQDALKNNEVVMTTQFVTGEDNHSIVIVGPRSDGAGYIAYDTDRTAGYYTLITEDQINPVYVIGVKKK